MDPTLVRGSSDSDPNADTTGIPMAANQNGNGRLRQKYNTKQEGHKYNQSPLCWLLRTSYPNIVTMPTYTLEQVKAHCKPDDIWIVLHNKVYDVTKYLEDHPGGTAVLIEVAGTDATEAFEEVGHSDEAREELEAFYVGDLPEEEQAEAVEVYRPTFEQVSQSAVVQVKKNKPSTWSSLLRAAAKLGVGAAFGAAALAAHRQGLTPMQFVHAVRSTLSTSPSILPARGSSSSATFWAGVGIATVTQFSITLGLGLWASTKLDVQQEFTHYLPRRPTSNAQLLRLKQSGPVPQPLILNPRQWRSFPLTKKTEVAPNVYRLIFSLPKESDILGLPTGQHVALRATINGTPVARSYTPISNNKDFGRIELLIKVYPGGTLTQHLAKMQIGDTIEMRGPKGAMKYSRTYARRVGMIAGGTGITPMYQLIRAICEDLGDPTQISLLYANNTEEDILLREELDNFAKQFPNKFQVRYVLARPPEGWTGYSGFVSKEMIEKHIGGPADEDKVLLCGPPPMINAMKKTLEGLGWAMPGAVAKAGDQVFLF
ncbi:hypothetical protein BJX61DRAFT_529257 [Aspergillus egyptiacus]|nr:hypothetical protein BJX61DRAFT_529257 [Aspergillus egyptiacus]